LIVGLLFAMRPWGIAGAGFAVFLAALMLALLMQGLVRRVVGLTWREIIAPLMPGASAAAGTALTVGAVTVAAGKILPVLPAWQLLVAQASVGGIFCVVFILFVRFHALQNVVDDVLDDIVPAMLRRQLARVRRGRKRAASV
jgi:hypothetical protein